MEKSENEKLIDHLVIKANLHRSLGMKSDSFVGLIDFISEYIRMPKNPLFEKCGIENSFPYAWIRK